MRGMKKVSAPVTEARVMTAEGLQWIHEKASRRLGLILRFL